MPAAHRCGAPAPCTPACPPHPPTRQKESQMDPETCLGLSSTEPDPRQHVSNCKDPLREMHFVGRPPQPPKRMQRKDKSSCHACTTAVCNAFVWSALLCFRNVGHSLYSPCPGRFVFLLERNLLWRNLDPPPMRPWTSPSTLAPLLGFGFQERSFPQPRAFVPASPPVLLLAAVSPPS